MIKTNEFFFKRLTNFHKYKYIWYHFNNIIVNKYMLELFFFFYMIRDTY